MINQKITILRGPEYETPTDPIERVRIQASRKINQNSESEKHNEAEKWEWVRRLWQKKSSQNKPQTAPIWQVGGVEEPTNPYGNSLFAAKHALKKQIVLFDDLQSWNQTKQDHFLKLAQTFKANPWLVSFKNEDVSIPEVKGIPAEQIKVITPTSSDWGSWVVSSHSLMVLGGIGRPNHQEKTLGSTVQKLLEKSGHSVLMTNFDHDPVPQKVAVAWDGQKDSLDVILQAQVLCELWGCDIEVIHFGESDLQSPEPIVSSEVYELKETQTIGQAIVDYVQNNAIDLLFMKTAYPKSFEDSVAIDVLFSQPCDLWLMRS